MANAILSYENKGDPNDPLNQGLGAAPVFTTVSSQVITMPITNLFIPHIARKWRSIGNNETFTLDLTSTRTVDLVALFGLRITGNGTIRVRLFGNDGVSLIADAGTWPANGLNYGSNITIFDFGGGVTNNVRFIRVDIQDSALSYLEVGRIFVGRQNKFSASDPDFSVNFSYGWSYGWTDRSIRSKSRGGQTLIYKDNGFRTLDVSFDMVTTTERNNLIEEMDRVYQSSYDALLITDPSSTNLGRDSIFGLVTDLSPVVQTHFDRFSKKYRIEERL